MSFSDIDTKVGYNGSKVSRRTSGGSTKLHKLMNATMESAVILKTGRKPAFRPSSFPSCSILNWMQLIRYNTLGYAEYKKHFSMEYYTKVGTVVHEITQYFAGFTGKFWGHWKCINPKCKECHKAADTYDAAGNIIKHGPATLSYTTDNICPRCKEPMFYIEFTIKYKGAEGHIDAIIEIGDYWVVLDYKTTSFKRVASGDLPEKKHLKQIPYYTHVMAEKYAKKYGKKIRSFALAYIPRDNPFEYVIHEEKWTPEWTHKMRRLHESEAAKWEAINHSLDTDTESAIIEHKPCSRKSDYQSRMCGYGECSLSEVCFNKTELRAFLTNWKKQHKRDPMAGVDYEEIIKHVISNAEYSAKKEKRISL
jgi:hypothetical protein